MILLKDNCDFYNCNSHPSQKIISKQIKVHLKYFEKMAEIDNLEKVQKMVLKAINLYDEIGTKSFEQFDTSPKFHDGALYVYVIRADDARMMVHVDKSLIGKNVHDLIDVDGINLGELFIKGATESGAWVSYKFKHPVNQEILPKKAWVIKHDGFVFGSGTYLQEN